MRVLVLGADGMLGHVVELFLKENKHQVYTTTRGQLSDYQYDAYKNVYQIKDIIQKNRPEIVVNCIGILNQAAEDDRALATLVNSFLPNYLNSLSQQHGFYFVHISTDCVFSGDQGDYQETTTPDARSFYGRSKALGEINNHYNVTLRTSIIGPDTKKGIGLFQWFSQQKQQVSGYTKVFWSGVTTIELARQIEHAMREKWTGIVHIVNNEKITKADLLRLFNQYFDFNITIVEDDTVCSDKSLKSTVTQPSIKIPTYEQMIRDMRQWVDSQADMYKDLKERMTQ